MYQEINSVTITLRNIVYKHLNKYKKSKKLYSARETYVISNYIATINIDKCYHINMKN